MRREGGGFMDKDKIWELTRLSHLDVYGMGKDRKKFLATLQCFVGMVELELREKHATLCGSMAPAKREFDERFYDACYVCAGVIRSGQ